jgi:hypothetical protein
MFKRGAFLGAASFLLLDQPHGAINVIPAGVLRFDGIFHVHGVVIKFKCWIHPPFWDLTPVEYPCTCRLECGEAGAALFIEWLPACVHEHADIFLGDDLFDLTPWL